MQFINPKTDFAFKKIFGSEESQDILVSLLNALLHLESSDRIESVAILDPYLRPKVKGMKDTYLDIRAKDGHGKSYIIEMQVLNVQSLEKRILYNACKTYTSQLLGGDGYHLLTHVIAITITNFMMFPELDDTVNTFKLSGGGHDGKKGHLYSDDLQLVFAELPKFTLKEDQLTTALDRWFYFLKHAGSLEAVPKTLSVEPAIAHALDMAKKANLSEDEWEEQDRQAIFLRDQVGIVEQAKLEGKKEGREKGREEGREEGSHTARLAIAKNLLPLLDNDAIAANTGLSVNVITRLRDDLEN